jgi:DNA primase
LTGKGFNALDIERAGINFKSERGSYIDRFRGRIMFPIYNHTGKVVGFTARILPEFDTGETGKYINSPETAIFNKSRVLYGFHKAKNHIREMQFALMVEGQMDVLMCVQDGLKNVVATSGTALTIDHLKTLKKQTDNVMFSFDNDDAGQKAAERSIDLAKNLDFNVKVLSLGEYKDPADAIKAKPGIMMEYAKVAKEAMEFYIDRYLSHGESFKNDAPKFKKNLHVVLEKIKALPSAVEREHWIRQLTQTIDVSEHVLREDMNNIEVIVPLEMRPKQPEMTLQEVQGEKMRIDLISERALRMAMVKESFLKKFEEYAKYLPKRYRRIYDGAIDKTAVDDPALLDEVHTFALMAGMDTEDANPDKIEKEFDELLGRLRQEALKEKQMLVMRAIRQAERQGDEEKAAHYLKQFDEVSKLLQNER